MVVRLIACLLKNTIPPCDDGNSITVDFTDPKTQQCKNTVCDDDASNTYNCIDIESMDRHIVVCEIPDCDIDGTHNDCENDYDEGSNKTLQAVTILTPHIRN